MDDAETVQADQLPAVLVDDVYPSRAVLKAAVEAQALRENWDVGTIDNCRVRFKLKCRRTDSCLWRLNARPVSKNDPNTEWRVSSITDEHTCLGSAPPIRAETSKLKNMIPVISERLGVTHGSKTSDIQSILKKANGGNPSIEQVQRLKRKFVADSVNQYIESYRLIPSFLEELKKKNPGIITNIELDAGGWIKRVFISPPQSNQTFKHSLHFLALDATFTRNGFIDQRILLACGRDGENRTVIYAWALAKTESKDS
jgi:hypothetical protein